MAGTIEQVFECNVMHRIWRESTKSNEMEVFLKLRARGSEMNLLARSVAILEDGFTLALLYQKQNIVRWRTLDKDPQITDQ